MFKGITPILHMQISLLVMETVVPLEVLSLKDVGIMLWTLWEALHPELLQLECLCCIDLDHFLSLFRKSELLEMITTVVFRPPLIEVRHYSFKVDLLPFFIKTTKPILNQSCVCQPVRTQ